MPSWRSAAGAIRTGMVISGGVAASTIAVIAVILSGGGTSGCTQTFTTATVGTSPLPGDSVNTAIQNGSGSTVLCFAAGSYGELDFYNATPTGVVTLRPVNGATVSGISFNLNGVKHVLLDGFNAAPMGGMTVQQTAAATNQDITFSHNQMISGGVTLRDSTNANANINIQDNTFIGFTTSPEEGRLDVKGMNACPDGVTIQRNVFGNGQSDGIDTDGASCGTVIQNNEIFGINEGNCGGIHCDGFQDNGGGTSTILRDNWFHDNSDCFLLDDGSTSITISNNVCATATSSFWMQFGGARSITLDHNTVTSTSSAQYGNDHNGNPSSNVTFTNNIFASSLTQNPGEPPTGTTTIDYNMCPGGCAGAHSVSGSPTFVGGSTPSSFAGFALAGGSAGKGVASGGTDIGVNP